MQCLLDTNVLSEWVKPRPNPGVVRWLAETDEDRIFLSVVTLTELRYGIERMATGKRRTQLDVWLRDELPLRFEKRIVPIDEIIADACGKLTARCDMAGRTIHAMDALIAATAIVNNLTLVTPITSDIKF